MINAPTDLSRYRIERLGRFMATYLHPYSFIYMFNIKRYRDKIYVRLVLNAVIKGEKFPFENNTKQV